jgi:hypothetical protein
MMNNFFMTSLKLLGYWVRSSLSSWFFSKTVNINPIYFIGIIFNFNDILNCIELFILVKNFRSVIDNTPRKERVVRDCNYYFFLILWLLNFNLKSDWYSWSLQSLCILTSYVQVVWVQFTKVLAHPLFDQ